VRGGRWEVGGARCEVGGGRWEVRGARCEVRGGRWEVGGGRCEVEGEAWQQQHDERRPPAPSRMRASWALPARRAGPAAGRQAAAGSRQPAGRQQQAGSSRQAAAGGPRLRKKRTMSLMSTQPSSEGAGSLRARARVGAAGEARAAGGGGGGRLASGGGGGGGAHPGTSASVSSSPGLITSGALSTRRFASTCAGGRGGGWGSGIPPRIRGGEAERVRRSAAALDSRAAPRRRSDCDPT
jgi:hypothetical protein